MTVQTWECPKKSAASVPTDALLSADLFVWHDGGGTAVRALDLRLKIAGSIPDCLVRS